MQEKQIFLHVIDTLWKWRIHLLTVLLITGIVVSAVMLSKPNYYKASTIFYPASTSIQKPVFTEADQNINYYGDDHDVDRMLSIATSGDTKWEIVEELNLRAHFSLGDEDEDTEKLMKLFNKMYRVMKTEYDAVKIVFQDTDPKKAAEVANYARQKVDKKTQGIIHSAQQNVLKNAVKALDIIQSEINQHKELLKAERQKYGIYDTESQAEAFAIVESRVGNTAEIKRKVESYTEGISLVKALEDQIEFSTENLVDYQSNYYRLKSALASDISALHVVQLASVPVSKAGPFRSLYVLGALVLVGLLSSIIILMIESLKK